MYKEGNRKSNDIRYAQVNEIKVMIYCRCSKSNETKKLFLQFIKYKYGNVDYWITFSNQTIFVKKALSASSFKPILSVLCFGDAIRKDACNLS